MEYEIPNRVSQSSLEVFDLQDYFPTEEILFLDIKQWLFEEIILREKPFRESVKNHHWEQYKGKYVAMGCSSEAIIPAWAYLLVASHLLPWAKKTIQGSIKDLLISIYQERLNNLDYAFLQNKPVIIKGCSQKPVPEEVYVLAMSHIQPLARSVMYGEACSAVPIFKQK